MLKIKTDSVNDQRDKSMDKASVVFLKLYARNRGKYKGWNEVRSYTLPITKEIKPGAEDV